MDFQSVLGLAKKGYEAYEAQQQSNTHKTGGEEYNSPDNRPPQQQHHSRPQNNDDSGEDSGDHGNMINQALSHLKQTVSNEPTDEHHLKQQHDEASDYHEKVYKSQSTEGLNVQQIGSAAAMQIFKQFSSGGSGGMDQSQMISLAIQEASKLLSGSSAENKQQGMNSAATTALKLFAGSSLIGGSNSGGLGTMMSVASKLF